MMVYNIEKATAFRKPSQQHLLVVANLDETANNTPCHDSSSSSNIRTLSTFSSCSSSLDNAQSDIVVHNSKPTITTVTAAPPLAPHASSSSKGNANSNGIVHKCSKQCLIAFSSCTIIILVLCCVTMAIFLTNLLLNPSFGKHSGGSNSMKKLLEAPRGEAPASTAASDPSPASSLSSLAGNQSSKAERNANSAFNWFKDTLKSSLFNIGEAAASAAYPNNGYSPYNKPFYPIGSNNNNNNNNEFVNSECGKPSIMPSYINTRIMNGREAVRNSWPWAVSISLHGPRDQIPHACGGTLISKRYVLTAAHCLTKSAISNLVGYPDRRSVKYPNFEKMIKIHVGVHDRIVDVDSRRVYNVASFTLHSEFDSYTFKNDLALIRLDRDVDMGSHQVSALPVCLTRMVQVMPGDVVYAIGWGFTENSRNQASRYLMQVDLTVQRKENCLLKYIDHDQFCAGNTFKRKDTCNGDSGGPILKLVGNRWTLMGVVSNGDAQCSGTGIYTNIPYFYDWIQNHMTY